MLKSYIHLKNKIFYSPLHDYFKHLDSPEQDDSDEILLKIRGHEEKIFEFLINNYNNYVSRETLEATFPECSDPYNKTLDRLRRDKIEGKLELYGLIKKPKAKQSFICRNHLSWKKKP